MDHNTRMIGRQAALGDIEAQARQVRALMRSGQIPPVGLITPAVMREIGHAKPSSVRNSHVRQALIVDNGWTAGETYIHHVEGLDCGTWTHCGWECCGPCPTCGDDWDLARERDEERTLLYPPLGLSARKAQKECYAVMTATAKKLYG